MKTLFTLDQLMDAKKIDIGDIRKAAAKMNKKVNFPTLVAIRDNTIKRLPLETAEVICSVLQVTPDDWIKVIDSPVPLESLPLSSAPIEPQITLTLKEELQRKGWQQADLVKWLDQHQVDFRPNTLSDINNNESTRLPVDLIAPLSVAIGKTPGVWMKVSRKLLKLNEVMDSLNIKLDQLQELLKTKGVTVSLEELSAIYHGVNTHVSIELLVHISEVLQVSVEALIETKTK
ncbi:helix-turn-helix domain-containing protein [Paenibacillus bovis]|uniref:HTH cro/C1-type domain-containing protein n=1 Tax=Paenibacillus bovis TaxID=1616788 RepID=A0A1X9T409_9BACL|nr:helix-turn-helix transcriptional regulator [Paenibacillus bovis]ARR10634.1 hypothetical protein AR543_p0026 [Paenibacillus bovis]